jgi:hypothetical protein
MTREITGWRIIDREDLIEYFPPHYSKIVADHVTLRHGTNGCTPLPTARRGEIIAEVDDGAGVQAFVVLIGGTTDRGDGRHFHATWSLGPERQAKDSNAVISNCPWRLIQPPIAIGIEPARWNS